MVWNLGEPTLELLFSSLPCSFSHFLSPSILLLLYIPPFPSLPSLSPSLHPLFISASSSLSSLFFAHSLDHTFLSIFFLSFLHPPITIFINSSSMNLPLSLPPAITHILHSLLSFQILLTLCFPISPQSFCPSFLPNSFPLSSHPSISHPHLISQTNR